MSVAIMNGSDIYTQRPHSARNKRFHTGIAFAFARGANIADKRIKVWWERFPKSSKLIGQFFHHD